MSDPHKNYLRDLGTEIVHLAGQLAKEARPKKLDNYQKDRLCSYCEFWDLRQQARMFGIRLSDVWLQGVENRPSVNKGPTED